VLWIALVAVGSAELARSSAPLALVFERLTGASPLTMSLIAVVATVNGIIVQIIMASRVLYGLASQGDLPQMFCRVNRRTRTPVIATVTVSAIILALALLVPLHDLAEVTARMTLVVFAIVNLALVAIKRRAATFRTIGFVAPGWVPWAGATACVLLLALDIWNVLRVTG
jgi:APA family basic amino acid/polyamine antiporter